MFFFPRIHTHVRFSAIPQIKGESDESQSQHALRHCPHYIVHVRTRSPVAFCDAGIEIKAEKVEFF